MKKTIFVLILLAAASLVAWLAFSPTQTEEQAELPRVSRSVVKKGKSASKAAAPRRRPPRRTEVAVRPEVTREKPSLDLLDESEEKALTELQRELIMSIRQALDSGDRKRLLAIVQKMQRSEEWPDGIPSAIKRAAILAMGWFGADCIPEMAGFLADGDEMIVNSAIEQFQNALMDVTLNDRQIAQFMIAASKVVTQVDAMSLMMVGFNNMRHSVAVATMCEIMESGNSVARQLLPENVTFYTCEDGLDTPEKLVEWLHQNPDNDFDEDFYGGSPRSESL